MEDIIYQLAQSIGLEIGNIQPSLNTWRSCSVIGKPQANRSGAYISSSFIDPINGTDRIIFTFKNFITDEKLSSWVNKPKGASEQTTRSIMQLHYKGIQNLEKDNQEDNIATIKKWTTTYDEFSENVVHQYLDTKKMNGVDVRFKVGDKITLEDEDNFVKVKMLLYPLVNIDNEIVCYQSIYYDSKGVCQKRWRGSPSGGFFKFGEITENTKCILIGEGIATVWAMSHLSDNWIGISTGSASNLEAIVDLFFNQYPKIPIFILADNDCGLKKNVGLFKTKEILKKYKPYINEKGKLINDFRVLRLIPETPSAYESADWWDNWNSRGDNFCIDFINGYLGLLNLNDNYGIENDNIVKYKVINSLDKTEEAGDEIITLANDVKLSYSILGFPILSCSAIQGGESTIIENTLNTILFKAHEPYFKYIQIEVDRKLLTSPAEFKKKMFQNNWSSQSSTKTGEGQLFDLVAKAYPHTTYLPVRGGWVDQYEKFGLPGRRIGHLRVVPYDKYGRVAKGLDSKGTLMEWKNNIGAHINGIKIAQIIYAIFGYALIAKFGNTKINPILMLKVNSSYGKSLLGSILATMSGKEDILKVADSRSGAGLENIFVDFNDLPLFIDEITSLTPEAITCLGYLYGNGTGAQRGTIKAGESQATLMWRGCAYATSEKTLAQLRIQHDLPPPNAGEEIRIINLSLDFLTAEEQGIFYGTTIDGSYTLFTKEIRDQLRNTFDKFYGTPLVCYVAYLENKGIEYIKQYIIKENCAFVEKNRPLIKTIMQERMLNQFGELTAGFKLVIDAGICDITHEEATETMTIIFKKWLQYNQEITSKEAPENKIINFIQSQLDLAAYSGIHSTFADSGWDYTIQNGKFINGVFPLRAHDKTVVGTISVERGVNIVTIFARNINYVMGGVEIDSRTLSTNIKKLEDSQFIIELAKGNNVVSINDVLANNTKTRKRCHAVKLSLDKILEEI